MKYHSLKLKNTEGKDSLKMKLQMAGNKIQLGHSKVSSHLIRVEDYTKAIKSGLITGG